MIPEDTLIRQIKAGDESAFRHIFKYHYAPLCAIARNYVADPFSAQTIVDDVIFNLWEKRKEINISTSLRLYLSKAVRNKCLDYLKARRTRLEIPYSALIDDQAQACTARIEESHALGILLEKELEQKIKDAITLIPESSRAVFTLSRQEGLNYEQMASALGISVNTVKYHMKKALSIMHEALREYLIPVVFLISFFSEF